MMKKAPFLRFYLLVTACWMTFATLHAQTVTPGKGIGELKIGASEAQVSYAIGNPAQVLSYQEDKADMESSGYDVKEELQYFIKFDMVWNFRGNEEKAGAVFKVYFRKGKVVCITVSSYSVEEMAARLVSTPEAVHLLDPAVVIEDAYGKADSKHSYEGNHDVHYLAKGLSANIEDEEIRVFFIYAPMVAKKAAKFIKLNNN